MSTFQNFLCYNDRIKKHQTSLELLMEDETAREKIFHLDNNNNQFH